MKSVQVSLQEILKAIQIFSKKEENGKVLTFYRPDFNVWHKIPGIKHNWSPQKIEIDQDLNTLKVWRIADKEKPSVVVLHILHDEYGSSEISGLSANDLKHIDAPDRKPRKRKRVKKKESNASAANNTFE